MPQQLQRVRLTFRESIAEWLFIEADRTQQPPSKIVEQLIEKAQHAQVSDQNKFK